jgi:lipoprotein-anchoring transpeptidase ErfK/SrfK
MHMTDSWYYAEETVPPKERTYKEPLWLDVALTLTAMALLAGWVLMGVYAYYRLNGPIAPGVMVGQTEVGGMSIEQAAAVIDNDWNRERVLLVGDGTNYWEANALEFGLWVDPNATARQAFDYGRGDNRFMEILQIIAGSVADEINPVVVFSPQVAASQLANWGALVDQPPGPASLQYIAGKWSAVPGAAGVRLDMESTLVEMANNAELIVQSGYLPLATAPVQSQVEALDAKIAGLEEQLNRPLVIQGYDPIDDSTMKWSVPRETLGGWMQVSANDGGLSVHIDENALLPYLKKLEGDMADGRTLDVLDPPYTLTERWQNGQEFQVSVRRPATTYTVQAGDTLLKIAYRTGFPMWMILEANPNISANSIEAGQTLSIPSKDDLLPLPVIPNKRIVISISEQRLRVYENHEQIREFVISTGIDRSPTQPGVFQVQTHELSAYASVWDLTMPHFLGIYEAWPGFMNGIHGLPTLSSGVRLWESILGRPASYGCIILKLDTAEWLYNWAEDGVVVEITG